jgi:hypothetical protein
VGAADGDSHDADGDGDADADGDGDGRFLGPWRPGTHIICSSAASAELCR